jgi:hypothetical protein
MKFPKGKVIYDREEMETYAPLWRDISAADASVKAKRKVLSRKVFWASDAGLSDGTDPLMSELSPFMDVLKREARRLEPRLSEKQLRDFIFYVLHHCGDSLEYDLNEPPNN